MELAKNAPSYTKFHAFQEGRISDADRCRQEYGWLTQDKRATLADWLVLHQPSDFRKNQIRVATSILRCKEVPNGAHILYDHSMRGALKMMLKMGTATVEHSDKGAHYSLVLDLGD